MTTPQITIIDGNNITVRNMDTYEISVYESASATFAAHIKANVDKAAARQAVLDRLGITADEAQLLVG